jgi:hypothetical protein
MGKPIMKVVVASSLKPRALRGGKQSSKSKRAFKSLDCFAMLATTDIFQQIHSSTTNCDIAYFSGFFSVTSASPREMVFSRISN